MAQLKDLLVTGPSRLLNDLYVTTDIYEDGTALQDKYGASLSLSGYTLGIKSKNGATLNSVTLPTVPTVTLNGTATTSPSFYAPTAVGTSGQYLKSSGSGAPTWANFPTIPTVNNATLTIQRNGTTVKTFTANASSNVTANITVPTKTSELTNDSGYLTSVPDATATDKGIMKVPSTSGLAVTNGSLGLNFGAGLDVSNTNVLGHANAAITAKTTQAVYPIKFDSYGHITGSGNAVTIPTVNNATLTIQRNGTTVKTFTANASSNVTANIEVPIYSSGTAIGINSSNEISVDYSSTGGLVLDDGNSLMVNCGRGLNINSSGVVGHSNTSISAKSTLAFYRITIDSYGHITSANGPEAVVTAVDASPAAAADGSIAVTTTTTSGGASTSYKKVKGWASLVSRVTALEEQICLIEGTKIKMADGSEKNIEDVQTGDMVLSYNPAKAEQIPAMALKSVRTGVAKDFDVLVYENGNYAEMYQEHSIYDTALGYPHSHKEWNVGDEGLMVDGPSKLIRKTTSRHAIIKERFVLVTSTGLYYANGILMGIWPSTKYNITKHSCYSLNLPDDILNEFKREGELNDRSNTLEINPDFMKRSKTLQTTIYNLSKEIEDCKKNLFDTDYIVTKFTEGLISAAEWLKSKASRANWRNLINQDEGPLAEAREQLEALKQQIKGDNPSLKDIYWESVTKANEMLPAFQEWFENWQKPEE